MRKYATTIILASTIFIGEIHTFWEIGRTGLGLQNWIISAYKPMTVQWNVKYASNQLLPIFYFVAMWFYGKHRNKVNTTTVITFLWFTLIDTIMYFYNYKTYNYGPVYLWLAIIWIAVFHWKQITKYFWSKNHQ